MEKMSFVSVKVKRSICTLQKTKFSIKDSFSKCDQMRNFLGIWSHLLKQSVKENSIFCAVLIVSQKSLKKHTWGKTYLNPFQ